MAIDEQVALLKQGARAWNAWRASKPQAAVDLSHGALRGLALKGADLSGADLRDADLRGADLRDADLRGADLSSASLVGARLEGANLFKAIIDGADLTAADLRSVQFLQRPQLEAAHNWQSAYRDENLTCGAATPVR